ncbi:MAG: tubulin-like doman-containing protein [Acidobacteriia bacterium]|nr:tubulin-like doman-containing protein [Terriglobia bacterium]
MSSTVHHNHLIVGLGGTGGNIIRALRKLIYQNCRKEDPEGVNLQYLYVDTSKEMMAPDNPSWKILGRSVQLPERSQMLISGLNLRNVVDNLSSYPGISPWLGSRDDFTEILNSAEGAQNGAGQKRRLGRFMFASEAPKFRDRIKSLVKDMTLESSSAQRSNQTTFHVCCGLAGGTGSGSVIDAISQIRANFPEDQIILYALLPERNPAGNKAKPNYYANGFAALMELNALSVGTWSPHDVTGVLKGRLKLQDPFNCCYLFNDENDARISVDVDHELPDIVAAFLYQKIVEIQHIDWGTTNTLLRQESYENQDFSPECATKNRPRRSRRFFSFGIKQIAYPEVEIREYITYSFAHQAVLQLHFNKWVDGQGYREESSNQPFEEHVRDKATLEKWYLTDERLSLSEGILKAEINNKKWRTIAEFWKAIIPGYLTMVLDSKSDDEMRMLPELTRLCDEAYREHYRGEGVARFYETKRKGDLREQVREIRGRIENDLFDEWKNGAKSMHDISRLLSTLLASIEERINGMDDKVAKMGEESERYRENETAIAFNRQEWANMGKLSVLFLGKHKKLLTAQAEFLTNRYIMRTRVEGLRYAKDLLIGLRQELNSLASEISKASALISRVTKSFQGAIDSRCIDRAGSDLSRQIVRFYDPAEVRSFTREITTDLSEQRKQTSRVRERLAVQLGEKQTFSAFNSRISERTFTDILESTCQENAEAAHEEFVARYPDRAKVLEVSLLDLLRREFEGNDERLRSYIQNVMAMSKDYLRFNKSQKGIDGAGAVSANDATNGLCTSYLTVIVPEAPDVQAFRERFCRTIRDAATGETQVVTNARRQQEVTLINITNLFPARFVEVVKFLQESYLKRTTGEGGRRALVELHSEGAGGKLPSGQEMPDLFPESFKPEDLRPWVMIAEAMGILKIEPDAKTGLDKVYLSTQDAATGLDRLDELGPSIEKIIETADLNTFAALQSEIEPRLNSEYLHVSKRKELADALRARVQELAGSRKPNDPVFISLREALLRAQEILSMEEQNVYA